MISRTRDRGPLYLIEILHQTTTNSDVTLNSGKLYLIEILHQTTTLIRSFLPLLSCILSKFYIKPQHADSYLAYWDVVSYRNSTSNHNCLYEHHYVALLYLIEILHQTTTCYRKRFRCCCCILSKFYIKPQQLSVQWHSSSCCILSKFYIKPQHGNSNRQYLYVVSYRNSTSNHNKFDCLQSLF